MLDEVLNTIVVVLIGLQLVVIPFIKSYWLIGVLAVAAILIARLANVTLPALPVLRKMHPGHLAYPDLGGVRGGISLAMALTLPDTPYKQLILAVCYIIVVCSIIVQGFR